MEYFKARNLEVPLMLKEITMESKQHNLDNNKPDLSDLIATAILEITTDSRKINQKCFGFYESEN